MTAVDLLNRDWVSDVFSSVLGCQRRAGEVGRGQRRQRPGRRDVIDESAEHVGAERAVGQRRVERGLQRRRVRQLCLSRSEEHTSELQSLMRISYAVFCSKKKKELEQKEQTPPGQQATRDRQPD